jgi:hypothetical protein
VPAFCKLSIYSLIADNDGGVDLSIALILIMPAIIFCGSFLVILSLLY